MNPDRVVIAQPHYRLSLKRNELIGARIFELRPVFRYQGPLDDESLQDFVKIVREKIHTLSEERRESAATILLELTHNIFDYRESSGGMAQDVQMELRLTGEGGFVISAAGPFDQEALETVSAKLNEFNQLTISQLGDYITRPNIDQLKLGKNRTNGGIGLAVVVHEAKYWNEEGHVCARTITHDLDKFLQIEAIVA